MNEIVPTHPLQWLQGALTATLQVPGKPLLDKAVQLPVCVAGIACAKVVRPADQKPVQSRHHQADWQSAHPRCREFSYPLAGFGQRFFRGKAIQILPALPFQVVVATKYDRKIAGSGFC